MISKRDDQMRRPAGRRKCQSGNKLGIERVSSKASVGKQVTYAEAPNAGSGKYLWGLDCVKLATLNTGDS